MIVAGNPGPSDNLEAVTKTLAGVDDFQKYLKGYRRALEAGTSSSSASSPPSSSAAAKARPNSS